ncbi:helicase RepA family protein [Sphingomonadaceae bacterium OTU29MARTA1]|nr:helicase RepA family protein [Sphingomonadaceae bacterium OTU29MARTA1]
MNAAAIVSAFDGAQSFRPSSPLNGDERFTQSSNPVQIKASPFRWPDPRTLPRRPWVWGRWLLRSTVTAIVAPGGVGKSSFVGSMLLSLASAREDILGKTVWAGAKTVWYWNLEDTLDELEMQLTAAAMFHRVGSSECDGRIYLDSGPEGSELCIAIQAENGFQIAVPVVEALVAELIARAVDVLVIDPFVSSHSINENDNGAIDAVAKTWARIAKRANCAIVLVHHSRKLGGEKVSAESARGGSSLIAAARVTLVLNRMDMREAEQFGISDDSERRRLFTVQDDKSNRAPATKAQWFRIASQDVGNSTGRDDPYELLPVPWTPR